MLISVHIPKTAGTSFGKSLENHFGISFSRDYDDLPLNTPTLRRNLKAIKDGLGGMQKKYERAQCIHGHFLPIKYSRFAISKKAMFITWVRDPVERLASHYYYSKKTYDPNTSPILQRRMVEENWSLEKYCLSPELRNIYTKFFWGFPITHFAFIGITEHFDEDFGFFSKEILGAYMPLFKINTTDALKNDERYITDLNFRKRVESFHEKDVALYRKVAAERLTKQAHIKNKEIR